MQTILGQVTILLTKLWAVIIPFFEISFSLPGLVGPMDRNVSLTFWFALVTSGHIMFLTLLSLAITKYLSIYHSSTIMSDLNEANFLKGLSLFLITMSMALTGLEIVSNPSLDEMAVVQLFHKGKPEVDAKTETTLVVMTVVCFVIVALVQVRIEYDAVLAHDGQVGLVSRLWIWIKNVNGQMTSTGYSLSVNRIALGLGLILTLIMVFTMISLKKWSRLLFSFGANIVMPMLFILKHPKMRSVATKTLRNLSPCPSNS